MPGHWLPTVLGMLEGDGWGLRFSVRLQAGWRGRGWPSHGHSGPAVASLATHEPLPPWGPLEGGRSTSCCCARRPAVLGVGPAAARHSVPPEQMGRILQRTAISTNIKERLDFSCALFGPDGGLVSNAPHIPVHLGAMQETVQFQVWRVPSCFPWPPQSLPLPTRGCLLASDPAAGG